MGKSTASSCLKIIACGSDSVDRDELEAHPESKSSSDKRGWSFRKKSARHRVLSNTVVSETPSGNKDWPEAANANLQTQSNSTIPEKASVVQWADEKPQFPTVEKSQVSADEKPQVLANENPQISEDEKPQVLEDEKPQVSVDEKPQVSTDAKPQLLVEVSADEKPLISEKVKLEVSEDEKPSVSSDEKAPISSEENSLLSDLVDAKQSEPVTARVNDGKADVILYEHALVIQTAVRAFLARRAQLKQKHITKLQAAVRGHLVRRHAVGTLRCVQAIVKMQTLVRARHTNRIAEGSSIKEKLKGKENSGTKSEFTYISISKLLSNSFARQLLESTPRTKSINMKCDPSKSDSAWKWLERWMSVASPGNQPSPQSELSAEQQENEPTEQPSNLMESKVQLDSESMDFREGEEASLSAVPSESDDNLITYDADSLDFQADIPTLPPQPQNVDDKTSRDDCSIPTQLKEARALPEMEPNSFPANTEVEREDTHSLELSETESKKILHGSRKASNPAFIAAQSKFEELTLAAKSTKVTSLPNHKTEDESSEDTFSTITDHSFGAREAAPSENSVPHSTRAQVGGSECGTELSISSTLDSPDRSEVGGHVFEQELPSNGGTDHHNKSNGYPHIEDDSTNDLTHSDYVQAGREDPTDDAKHVDVMVSSDLSPEEQKPENNSVNVQIDHEAKTDRLYKSSPDASPRSHITVPESQGTPSSQVSVNPKKLKSENSGSIPKRRSAPASKKSPSKLNHAPGTTSSEQLSKDHNKNEKRRNSFGSTKAGQADQEARDNSTSSSLPSYMQATESARAKAIPNSSPRSSPDVHNKDEYIKKRHSLPGSNGRQGSPRIQRSLSNAQQGAKGNGTQSPQERKWQR